MAVTGVGDSCLAEFDRKIAEKTLITMNVGDFGPIPFQFPPKILNESNSSIWDETNMLGFEPIKIRFGSSGRKLSMMWEYIATDSVFTGETIAKACRTLKSYFYDLQISEYPMIYVTYPPITGDDKIDCRLMNVDITYGQEVVKSGDNYYPLYTKVQIVLELATTINNPKAKGGQDKQDVNPLAPLRPDWY